jgi:hypothetical protein
VKTEVKIGIAPLGSRTYIGLPRETRTEQNGVFIFGVQDFSIWANASLGIDFPLRPVHISEMCFHEIYGIRRNPMKSDEICTKSAQKPFNEVEKPCTAKTHRFLDFCL